MIDLDEHGEDLTSSELAELMKSLEGQELTFIIGGAFGLHDRVLKTADKRIAFGKATWPHQLVRAMLMEQLYRAQQIIKGHPYHK